MRLKVQKCEPDYELEIIEAERVLTELTDNMLPKDFWTKEEWNWIVTERSRIRNIIKKFKKELSMT